MRLKSTAALAALLALAGAGVAEAAPTTQNVRFTASDGVSLQATVRGDAPLSPRPTIVEFSPYGRNTGTFDGGPAYNHLLVQIRGTGDSDGSFDALGPRTQTDVAEVLAWACEQPWSDGRLGLNGFSATVTDTFTAYGLQLSGMGLTVAYTQAGDVFTGVARAVVIRHLHVPDLRQRDPPGTAHVGASGRRR